MKLFNGAAAGGAESRLFDVNKLKTAMGAIAPETVNASVTMLSLSEPAARIAEDVNAALVNTTTRLTDAQEDAAAMTLMQAANPEAHKQRVQSGYAEAIKSSNNVTGALALSGRGGAVGGEAINMQAYEERDFDSYKEYSVEFNVAHAEMDAVSELFFPSLLLPADQPVLRANLRSTVIQRFQAHGKDGKPVELNRENLAHAYTRPEILENSTTTVIPVVASDDSNADYFTAASVAPPYDVEVGGYSVKTAPLRPNVEGNLLSLATPGAFAPEAGYDLYDQLSPRVEAEAVDLSVTNGTDTSQLRLSIKGLPRANFVKSLQADSNEDFALNFVSDVISIDKDTLDITGAAAAALSAIEAGVKLRLRLRVSAELSLNTTNYEITNITAQVIGAYNATGEVPIEGALKTAVEALTITGNGLTLGELTLTNSNRAVSGVWVETTEHSRDFVVGQQAPIYHPMPTGQQPKQTIVEALIATSKASSCARGISALRNHLDSLSSFTSMGLHNISSSEMFPGAANEIVPYFHADEINVKQRLNSISTHEKGDDIKALFSTILTHYVSEMINRSNIQTARQLLHGTNSKLQVIIATDPEIAPWLMTSGDPDFLGRMVDYKVAASVNPELKGKIIVSFASDESIDGLDPCGFGRRGWTTELISTEKVQRGKSHNTEVSVATRELHTAVLPVACEFTVVDLDKAVTEVI